MELGKLIAYKYPNLKANKDYFIVDNGEGAYIAKWNATDPQPTDTELQAAWDTYVANPPQAVLSPIDDLQKQQTDLVFQLMVNGVI